MHRSNKVHTNTGNQQNDFLVISKMILFHHWSHFYKLVFITRRRTALCPQHWLHSISPNPHIYWKILLLPVALESLGCWRDTTDRAIPALEGLDRVLDGNYSIRQEAIEKCVQAGFTRSYNIIALQNGGLCSGSRNAGETYRKYGEVSSCSAKGEPSVNHVYRMNFQAVT